MKKKIFNLSPEHQQHIKNIQIAQNLRTETDAILYALEQAAPKSDAIDLRLKAIEAEHQSLLLLKEQLA